MDFLGKKPKKCCVKCFFLHFNMCVSRYVSWFWGIVKIKIDKKIMIKCESWVFLMQLTQMFPVVDRDNGNFRMEVDARDAVCSWR